LSNITLLLHLCKVCVIVWPWLWIDAFCFIISCYIHYFKGINVYCNINRNLHSLKTHNGVQLLTVCVKLVNVVLHIGQELKNMVLSCGMFVVVYQNSGQTLRWHLSGTKSKPSVKELSSYRSG
jgi:hypothetical protein